MGRAKINPHGRTETWYRVDVTSLEISAVDVLRQAGKLIYVRGWSQVGNCPTVYQVKIDSQESHYWDDYRTAVTWAKHQADNRVRRLRQELSKVEELAQSLGDVLGS